MSQQASTYPLTFSVDYPDRELNRVTTGFRLILAIPLVLLLAVFGRTQFGGHPLSAGLLLFLPVLALLVLRHKYPRGIFEFVVGVTRWDLRVSAYAFLLVTDRYPPFSLAP